MKNIVIYQDTSIKMMTEKDFSVIKYNGDNFKFGNVVYNDKYWNLVFLKQDEFNIYLLH